MSRLVDYFPASGISYICHIVYQDSSYEPQSHRWIWKDFLIEDGEEMLQYSVVARVLGFEVHSETTVSQSTEDLILAPGGNLGQDHDYP